MNYNPATRLSRTGSWDSGPRVAAGREAWPQRQGGDRIEWFTCQLPDARARRRRTRATGGRPLYSSSTAKKTPPPPPQPTSSRHRRPLPIARGQRAGEAAWDSSSGYRPIRRHDPAQERPGAHGRRAPRPRSHFFDGTVVHVRPDSLITIEETSENRVAPRSAVAWHIQSGEVNFQTVPRATCPAARPRSRRRPCARPPSEKTDGGIRVEESGDRRAKVFRGTIAGRDQERPKIAWPASQGAQDRLDRQGRARSSLPRVPALLAPPHQAEISYPDPRPRHHAARLEARCPARSPTT